MREGDSYAIVLTIKGVLTEDLEEFLEQRYPDENKLSGIQKLITDNFKKGSLKVLQTEPKVSFTNVKKRE